MLLGDLISKVITGNIKLTERVDKLVGIELTDANTKSPLFSSPHEGAAVILEELEETEDELQNVREAYDFAWKYIKLKGSQKEAEYYIEKMRVAAVKTAAESIQVAAMCVKYRQSLQTDEEAEEC